MTETIIANIPNVRRAELDVEDYATLTVTIVGGSVNATGVAFGFAVSPDSVNKESGRWPNIQGQRTDSGALVQNASAQTVTAGAVHSSYIFNVAAFKRFRMAVTAMAGGPFDVIFALSKVPTAYTPLAPLATQPVSNTVLATGATGLGKAEDAVHASGDVGIEMLGVRNDAASTVFTSANGDYSPVATDDRGRVFTVGTFLEDDAHASGNAGTQILGVRVPATPAAQTSAPGDYGAFAITAEGKQITAGQGAEENSVTGINAVTSTTDVTIIAAQAAGIKMYITDIVISNGNTGGSEVQIKSGSATNLARLYVPANNSVTHSFKTPISTAAATALVAALSAGTNAVWVTAVGYRGV